VETAVDPETGLARLREAPFDVVITDLCMPGLDGLEVLRRARAVRPECEVVLITGRATVDSARAALKQGAIDYLLKPFSIEDELLPALRRVLDARERPEPTVSRREAEPGESLLVGEGPALSRALERAGKIARSDSPVLILGESGSGKELFAQLVHSLSPRADRPFLRVSCAALPESLLENELFGHVRGAFTGAHRDQKGLFAAADGGTLFLDEIGELSPSMQPKLLRVLQEGEFQRIGEPGRVLRADVRIVAATHCDLRAAVSRGTFRDDLFYRLAVVPIEVPPLRERTEDLLSLIEHFCARLGSRARFTDDVLDLMHRYPWPGNVRELANAVEHAVVLADGDGVLRVEDLPAVLQEFAYSSRTGDEDEGTLEAIERQTILQTLRRTRWNRTEAARLLGVTRRALGYRIHKYALDPQIDQMRSAADGAGRAGPFATPPASSGTPLS